ARPPRRFVPGLGQHERPAAGHGHRPPRCCRALRLSRHDRKHLATDWAGGPPARGGGGGLCGVEQPARPVPRQPSRILLGPRSGAGTDRPRQPSDSQCPLAGRDLRAAATDRRALAQGAQYHVDRLDWEEKKAYIRPVKVDYYTDANLAVSIKVLESFASRPTADLAVHHGEVQIRALATIFKKIRFHSHENIGSGPISL